MRIYTMFAMVILLAFTTTSTWAQRSNCSVFPLNNTINQPDGSPLTLVPFGTESVHYLETPEGYTVLLNNKTGFFEYASIDAQGNLDLSGVVASDLVAAASAGFAKTAPVPHLKYSRTQVAMLSSYFEQQNSDAFKKELNKAGPNVFPQTGNQKVPVLLIQYPDLMSTIPPANFDLLFNQPNYNTTGSFRDYYQKASFGKLNLTATVYGWYTADSGYLYYGNTSSPNYNTATRKLLLNAIKDADSAGVDFSQFDNDNDGYVDAVVILHSGIGAEESSAPNSGNYIWSFRSTLSSTQTPTADGKKFSAYCMFPEKRFGTSSMVGIGVMCHEFGHILDLPDLYAVNYSSEGDGNYTIMSGGPWLNNEKTPCMFDAWCRTALGWMTPTLIGSSGVYNINKLLVDSNFAYRINTPVASEYFLLENRQKKGFDAFLPSSGLAVWHVSGLAKKLSEGGGNNVNNDTSKFGLALLQADGLRELERNINRGNAGDLFPGTTKNKNITPFTNPNTNLVNKISGVNQQSNVYITNITINADSSISFKYGSQLFASFTATPVTGCVPHKVVLSNVSSPGSSFKWDFGGGRTNTTSGDTTLTFDEPGTSKVTLVVYDSLGVPNDSIVQTIQTFASPEAAYIMQQWGDQLKLINTSKGATIIRWKLGTSVTASDSVLTQVLPATGLFKYSIIAFNSNGCTDTAYGETYAYPTGLAETGRNISGLTAYPNPFRDQLKVSFTLKMASDVSVEWYNMIGEKVSGTAAQQFIAGSHDLPLSHFNRLPDGIYLLKITAGDETKVIRMMKAE